MRKLALITAALWVLTIIIRAQWVLPGGTVSLELACGGLFIMHNTAGFLRTGVAVQAGLGAPLPFPVLQHYSATLGAAFIPLWWVPCGLWLASSRVWLLRALMCCDIVVILCGLGLVVRGFMTSAQSQVDPDTVLPMAVGVPFLLLGGRGVVTLRRYRLGQARRREVIRNVWFVALAWGLATVFGVAGVVMFGVLAVMALLVTRSLTRDDVRDGDGVAAGA